MSDAMIREFWSQRRLTAPLTERRTLEPICAAMVTYSFKLALQNCQKALKIRPYNPIVQTLQAIVLHRTGQPALALAQIEEIAKDVKGGGKAFQDADFLMFCSYIFEENGRHSAAEQLWKEALRVHPDNIPLAAEACYYFIRIGSSKALEETCLRLINEKNIEEQNPELYQHLYWHAIMAFLLQYDLLQSSPTESTPEAHRSDPAAQAALLERAAALKPESQVAEADSHRFTLVLRLLQHKAEQTPQAASQRRPASLDDLPPTQQDLLRTLASEVGSKLSSNNLDIELIRREMELKYGDETTLKALWERMRSTLVEGKDTNWSTIDTLIQAAYKLSVPHEVSSVDAWWSATTDGASAHEKLVETRSVLEALAGDEQGFSRQDRGYTLGLLRLATYPSSAPYRGETITNLLILYIKRYADKNCCHEDLRPTLEQSSESVRQAVSEWLDSQHDHRQRINVESLQALQLSINVEKIRRLLQMQFASAQEEELKAALYAKAYFDSLHFGKDLLATDLQPSDDFALLAAQALLGAWQQSGSTTHLEQAAGILEYAIRKSKYRFQIRVLLIRLYRILGATSLVLHHYRLLDIKQIQFDSLAHWVFERAAQFVVNPSVATQTQKPANSRQPETFQQNISFITNWYTQADNEVTPSVVQAWNNQAYSIIDEYTQLQTRLKHSLTRHMMKFESIRAGICHEVLDSEATLDGLQMKLESIEIAGLWDNRDYSILPNHQPTNAKPVELQTRTGPRTDARWLKALWSIYHAYSTNSAIPGDLTLDGGCSTSREMAFLEWAKRIASWLSGSQADMEDATFVGFFKDCHSELQSATLDTPTWELLHTAQLALEAYSLLDVAFRVMSRSSTAANAKQIKLFKRLRQDLKPIMKAISTRLKALVEDMSKRYKGRNKVEGLLPLFGAEAKVLDEFLLDFATQLVEARKTSLTQLANSITKRSAAS